MRLASLGAYPPVAQGVQNRPKSRFFEVVLCPATLKWSWHLFALPKKYVYTRRKKLPVKIWYKKWFLLSKDHAIKCPISAQNQFGKQLLTKFLHKRLYYYKLWAFLLVNFQKAMSMTILDSKWAIKSARFRPKTTFPKVNFKTDLKLWRKLV